MKSLTLPTVGKDVQQWGIFIQLVGVLISTTDLEKSLAQSSQVENAYPYDLEVLLLRKALPYMHKETACSL